MDPEGSHDKLWTTCSFRLYEDEKVALQILADKLITTPSRLIRFAVCSLLLRQQSELQSRLNGVIYSRNV